MRLHICFLMIAAVALAVTPALADSNASGGSVTNSESVFLGSGPFGHGDAIGSLDNTVITGIGFTGGFTATHIRFAGTQNEVYATTWATEADIQISNAGTFHSWQNPGPAGVYVGPITYDFAHDLTGTWAGGVDPGTGTWDVEFYDSFDDGAGADQQSSNVDMIFEEIVPLADSTGSFALAALDILSVSNSVGEFAVAGVYDLYTITLNTQGELTFEVDEDPTGFLGSTVDTEIAIFDATGILLAEDDDGGNGTYSKIESLLLPAGTYTLAVAPFLAGTSFADGFVVDPGTATGDYTISVSLPVVPVELMSFSIE